MFIAFIGPTFNEALNKPIQIISFLESMFILIIFTYLILVNVFNKLRFRIYIFIIIINCFFWFLFVHYPFGILNPGSALRYRSGFYPFLILLLFYFHSKIFLSFRMKKTRIKEKNEEKNRYCS